MRLKYFIFILIIFPLFSQTWHNHSTLDWSTIETEHFVIHFHLESERSAREAATVAEQIYLPITEYYNFKPDSKTHIILKDTDDYANGAAYYYDNKIEIWALPLDFELRGSHRWLQNVVTHEFTHIVQIGAAMKFPRRFPAAFIQIMGYEDEKRPDVLYGYPNTIVSYPIPGVTVPPWLAEGTAQFMFDGANYDYWDSHRDMTLRDRVLNDNLLSLDEMSSFGKRGIGNESIYSMGFKFSQYLYNRFGNAILSDITKSLSSTLYKSISQSMKDVTGISGYKIYDDWVESLQNEYSYFLKKIKKKEINKKFIYENGTTNIHPVWSPSAKKFAFLSNKDNDYFSQTDLYVYSFSDSSIKKVAAGVQKAPTWMNDSTIIFSKRSKPDINGSKFYDLYSISLNDKDKKPERLTNSARLYSPIYISELNKIAAINIYDGTSNIYVSDADSINFSSITDFNNGIYLSSLSWNGSKIFADGVNHHTNNLYSFDIETGDFTLEMNNSWDDRDFDNNQSRSIYSRDKSGVFNLFYYDEDKAGYITNVPGGAFMPSISNDGRILFSEYIDGGYKISLIDSVKVININDVGYSENNFLNIPKSIPITNSNNKIAKPYNDSMSKLSLMPRIMIDYKTVKPGFYFMSNDYLDKLSIFGGVSANLDLDLDLFLTFEFKKYWPTFYSNFFWVTRHKELQSNFNRANGTIAENVSINSDLAFLLFSADIGTRFSINGHKIWLDYTYTNYREHVNQTVVQNAPYDTLRYNGDLAFDYYRGHSTSVRYNFTRVKPAFLNNMMPGNGLVLNSRFSYEWNNFMNGFGVNEEYSTFGANFSPHNTFKATFESNYQFKIKRDIDIFSVLDLKLGWLSNNKIDDFFHFYSGGLPGIKGYTFYNEELTGTNQIIISTSNRFPVFKEQSYVFANLNIQNMSLGIIGQIGGSFTNEFSNFISAKKYKSSAGIELRLNGFSFYAYPTAFQYEFHKPINDLEIGKHYFSVLFGF